MLINLPIGWIIGLALMFGLAFVMNYVIDGNIKMFFVFLTLFNSFIVWANLLPLWTLITNIIFLTFIIYIELSTKGSN